MKHQNLYHSIMMSVKRKKQKKSYAELAQSFISYGFGGIGLFSTGSLVAVRAIQTILLDSTLDMWFY